MKILIDAHVFDGKHQGTRTYIRGIYRELIRISPEWEFYFAAKNRTPIIDEIGQSENVKFIQLKLR